MSLWMRDAPAGLYLAAQPSMMWGAMNKFKITTLVVIVILLAACRRAPEALPTPVPQAAPTVVPTPTLAVPQDTSVPDVPAAPETAVVGAALPGGTFSGTFEGYLDGDNGSRAPVQLVLVQAGDTVNGTISIADGLFLDGGNCGATAVPTGAQAASGMVDPANPSHLDADATVMVQGLSITIALDADMSPDGQTLTAQATIDLPLLCGRDPAIGGVFTRAN